MSSCPKCQTPVPDSAFGLYSCAKCKSVLSIDFNGGVSFDDIAPPSQTSSNASQGAPTSVAKSDIETPQSLELPAEPVFEPVRVTAQEPATTVLTKSSPWAEPSIIGQSPSAEEAGLGQQGEPYEFPSTTGASSSSGFSDVIAFANSEVSDATQGPLLYDVLIRGIDSEDLRKAVKESLIDSHFGWNADEVFSKMRGGSLLLSRLNAVKASVLVNRLKGCPIEISWVQNGIYEVNP